MRDGHGERLLHCETLETSWLLRRSRWWFAIVHRNGQVLLTSEMYLTQTARDDTVANLVTAFGFQVKNQDVA